MSTSNPALQLALRKAELTIQTNCVTQQQAIANLVQQNAGLQDQLQHANDHILHLGYQATNSQQRLASQHSCIEIGNFSFQFLQAVTFFSFSAGQERTCLAERLRYYETYCLCVYNSVLAQNWSSAPVIPIAQQTQLAVFPCPWLREDSWKNQSVLQFDVGARTWQTSDRNSISIT